MHHIDERVSCVRSHGSRARGTVARVHGMPRVFEAAFGIRVRYVIEVISKTFDRQRKEEKIKTLIHELLHIPKSFGGGYRSHAVVNERHVNRLYASLKRTGALADLP